jgi:hypothetical protein
MIVALDRNGLPKEKTFSKCGGGGMMEKQTKKSKSFNLSF